MIFDHFLGIISYGNYEDLQMVSTVGTSTNGLLSSNDCVKIAYRIEDTLKTLNYSTEELHDLLM